MNAPRKLVLSSALLIAACSSNSTSPGPPDGASMSLGDFCAGFMTATAQSLSRCLGGAESTWTMEISAQFSCSSLAAAVAAGRVTYDPMEAGACLAAYPTLSCSDLLVGPTVCAAPLGGTVANGGACLADGDCKGASYCSGVGHGNASCQGKCAPYIAAGQPCLSTQECAVGFTCGGVPGSLTCISDRHPLANPGASCAAPASPNMPSIQCAPGLSCQLPSFACATTVQEGGACTPGERLCEFFTYCDSATQKCKSDSGEGGVCGSAPSGELMNCLPGLYCKLPSKTSPTGTCATLGAGGAACMGDFECASNSCSSQSTTGTCSAPCTQE
jgi:hypothetical protein